ncbi:signal peptidase I [Salinibacillus xinjiangensis]|uniref:Signal peptidase I n=1 Tax=Salinibacillus xinjiangensis TaxID=1229268 RepID=A0A6G1X254_9BACI|nr:signal peptidase I [Salinibacillus xinjiangensis]MRG85022.1 signal peptidase I [Salinibacillus xinjiangensis]
MLKKIIFLTAGALAIILLFFIFQAKGDINKLPSFFGYKPLTILSNSMVPDFEAGDIIVIDTNEAPKVNEVITYVDPNQELLSHRVIDIVNQDGQNLYQTKGDANNIPDREYVSEENIIGVKVFTIPLIGHIASFIASPTGIFLLIVLPIILVVIIEFFQRLNIIREKSG